MKAEFGEEFIPRWQMVRTTVTWMPYTHDLDVARHPLQQLLHACRRDDGLRMPPGDSHSSRPTQDRGGAPTWWDAFEHRKVSPSQPL